MSIRPPLTALVNASASECASASTVTFWDAVTLPVPSLAVTSESVLAVALRGADGEDADAERVDLGQRAVVAEGLDLDLGRAGVADGAGGRIDMRRADAAVELGDRVGVVGRGRVDDRDRHAADRLAAGDRGRAVQRRRLDRELAAQRAGHDVAVEDRARVSAVVDGRLGGTAARADERRR